MRPPCVPRESFVRLDTVSTSGRPAWRAAATDVENLRPLKVRDLAKKFGKSAYTIREWAKKGKLNGAKRVGRDWAFPLDVDYIDVAVAAPTLQLAVKQALDLLDRYPVGAARAA